MLSDKLNQLADDTALNTGAAGSYIIGDQIDLQVTDHGIGALLGSGALFIVISVEDDASSAGNATAQFNIVTDDNAALSSPAVMAGTPVFAHADMTPGKLLAVLPMPPGAAWQRYMGLQQVTGTAAFTGGSINAIITTTPPTGFQYPQNAAISY